jgi:hypothetical protein
MIPLRPWVRLDPNDEGRGASWYDGEPTGDWTPAARDRIPFPLNPVESPVVWIKCVFDAGPERPELRVVVDSNAFDEAYLNGVRLTDPSPFPLWDDANIGFVLDVALTPGRNVLAFRTPVSQYFHPDVGMSYFGADIVDPIVLMGDVDCEAAPDGTALLQPARRVLRTGPWALQGLRGYAGSITYRQNVSLDEVGAETWLDLGDVRVCGEVEVNGRSAGRRCWPPYQFHVGRLLRRGSNAIAITVTNSLDPLLGTVGWHNYTGAILDDAPSGLLGPVRLLVKA